MTSQAAKLISDLTDGRRKREDLSDAERRPVLDTRCDKNLSTGDQINRAFIKQSVARLNRDADAYDREQSVTDTIQTGLPGWSAAANLGDKFGGGGGSKKGKEYEPKASIRTICKQIGSFEFEKVMDFLRDDDCCDNLFHSTNSSIDSQFGVNDDENIIYYTPRGSSPDQGKKIAFSRLRNILSAIKKTP